MTIPVICFRAIEKHEKWAYDTRTLHNIRCLLNSDEASRFSTPGNIKLYSHSLQRSRIHRLIVKHMSHIL